MSQEKSKNENLPEISDFDIFGGWRHCEAAAVSQYRGPYAEGPLKKQKRQLAVIKNNNDGTYLRKYFPVAVGTTQKTKTKTMDRQQKNLKM